MRITKIGVKGLFGIFDHEIPINTQERVTIVHGPNGYGKTVMLRMIASLLRGDSSIFERTPFAEFSLSLQDGTEAIVRRRVEPGQESSPPKTALEFEIKDSQGVVTVVSPAQRLAEIPRAVLAQVDRFVPGYVLTGRGWMDDSGQTYSLS